MKKIAFVLTLTFLIPLTFSSCEKKSKAEKLIEDAEDVSEDIKDEMKETEKDTKKKLKDLLD